MKIASRCGGRPTGVPLMLFVLLITTVGGCATNDVVTGRWAHDDRARQIGAIHLVEDLRATTGVKTLVAAYGFTANGVTPSVARVVYGAGTLPRSEGSEFRLMLVDADGETLSHYMIRNPRRLLIERKGLIEEDEIFYVAAFPFNARAAQIRVMDRRGKAVAMTDVRSVIREFCSAADKDEDCANVPP